MKQADMSERDEEQLESRFGVLDDPAEEQRAERVEKAAEEARAAAAYAVFRWKGQPLAPLTVSRATLYWRLRAASNPAPPDEVMRHPELFLPQAIQLYFLLSHDVDELGELRADLPALQRRIDAWGDEQLDHTELAQLNELMLEILGTSTRTQAVARPDPHAAARREDDSGNVPSPETRP